MDRLRRSLRLPRRHRSPERQTPPELANSTTGKQELWQPDETAVKAGLCSFHVKYLGSVEVFESRGMPVCEGALKALRNSRRKPVKALLYVSGDGLRVVDQEHNRGLIVDQTIEKVSFCAPDRNNDKGFAYICRDGTSRRWMCHGFHATKESGERLSHAVGCAFAICLEKKKKRDEESTCSSAAPATVEQTLNPNWGDANLASISHDDTPTSSNSANQQQFTRTNQGYQSFRKQISITERLQDPQSAILTTAPSASQQLPASMAKPRPASNPALFQRQVKIWLISKAG
ncbi:hypothetical protein WR25_24761 [Diploscapter pachys]|uniref:PID domain-containing protein n=1 Tax=Diploscapter pachys TaxID=2018661 RepID=A0A2A2KWL4_9BILA|nr:hypothetical protein WR25_24761 [Diploscapter pachys]